MPRNEDKAPSSIEGLRRPSQVRKVRAREHISTITQRRTPRDDVECISGSDRKTGHVVREEAFRMTPLEPQYSDESQLLSPWCV